MPRRFPHLGSLSRFEGLTEEEWLCEGVRGPAHLYARAEGQYTLIESLSGSFLTWRPGCSNSVAVPD